MNRYSQPQPPQQSQLNTDIRLPQSSGPKQTVAPARNYTRGRYERQGALWHISYVHVCALRALASSTNLPKRQQFQQERAGPRKSMTWKVLELSLKRQPISLAAGASEPTFPLLAHRNSVLYI